MNETYQIRLARENELYQLNTIEEAQNGLPISERILMILTSFPKICS